MTPNRRIGSGGHLFGWYTYSMLPYFAPGCPRSDFGILLRTRAYIYSRVNIRV